MEVLQVHFSPKSIVIAEGFRFHKRNQREEETIAQYIADLIFFLSEHCICLVCGLNSESIQKRLLTSTDIKKQLK